MRRLAAKLSTALTEGRWPASVAMLAGRNFVTAAIRMATEGITQHVSTAGGAASDFIPDDIRASYEIVNHRNAAQILATGCASEFADIIDTLRAFRLTIADIRKPGGNESDIVKSVSKLLRPLGWRETRIKGDLVITKISSSGKKKSKGKEAAGDDEENTLEEIARLKHSAAAQVEEITKENFLDGHKVDYVKAKVAFDLEWNSKDQTFDRDLYAFRAFHDCDLIDVAVLLTRSEELNRVFERLGPELDEKGDPKKTKKGRIKMLKTKYGASTTWMGKLVYRLNAGRNGGCPVLALGITSKVVTDWADYDKAHPESGS